MIRGVALQVSCGDDLSTPGFVLIFFGKSLEMAMDGL